MYTTINYYHKTNLLLAGNNLNFMKITTLLLFIIQITHMVQKSLKTNI